MQKTSHMSKTSISCYKTFDVREPVLDKWITLVSACWLHSHPGDRDTAGGHKSQRCWMILHYHFQLKCCRVWNLIQQWPHYSKHTKKTKGKINTAACPHKLQFVDNIELHSAEQVGETDIRTVGFQWKSNCSAVSNVYLKSVMLLMPAE